MRILKPALVIPVGRLAIAQLMEFRVLKDVVGSQFEVDWRGFTFDAVPLPHPSGASTWHRTNPGRKLLAQALKLIEMHPAFAKLKGR